MITEHRVVPDVAQAAAALVADEMRAAAARGRFVLNLSGGSTPLAMFRRLAERRDLPWNATWIVWGDERFVPADHPDSNARAARETLLDRVPIPEAQIRAWPTDAGSPERARDAYAATLERLFPAPLRFDLTLLGLGADGHTASLFPGTGAATANGVAVVVRPEGAVVRLSMTAPTLSASRTAAFLVAGEAKRIAFEATLAGEGDLERYPARAIRPRDRRLWITDLAPAAD